MVWQSNFGTDSNDEGKLVYDLRTVYAIKVIQPTLEQIKKFRLVSDYPNWFESLRRDLRVEISKELSEDEVKEINSMINNFIRFVSNHQEAYLGQSESAEDVETIKEMLCQIEMLMLGLMQEHKMFGSKEDDEGL